MLEFFNISIENTKIFCIFNALTIYGHNIIKGTLVSLRVILGINLLKKKICMFVNASTKGFVYRRTVFSGRVPVSDSASFSFGVNLQIAEFFFI